MEKKKTLTEHNDLITAHYDMSAPEQDIFSLVLAQMKKEDPLDQRYHVSIKEIEALARKRVDYTKIGGVAKKLVSRVCTIIRDNGDPLYVGMVSDAEHIRGTGHFKIGVSPQIRPYLFDLKKNFTRYQLQMFGPLRSKYSKRIYKMLSQFKKTGILRISVEELKMRLKLLDPKTGKEVFANDWAGLKRKVLEVAQREINEHTDIRCNYEAHKTERKFTHLEFKIARVPQEQLKAMHGEDQATAELRKRLVTQFRLSDWQATDIIVHVPEQEIRKTFHEITVQLSDKRIQNIGGYTARVFNDKYNLGFFEKPEPENTPMQLDITTEYSAPVAHSKDSIPAIGTLIEQMAKVS